MENAVNVASVNSHAFALNIAKGNILSDICDGIIPSEIQDFQGLCDFVDPNVYLEGDSADQIKTELDSWLKSGRHE